MSIQVYEVGAFVKQGGGGNPAGVVLNAEQLSANVRQQIAAELAFSETAFAARSASGTLRLEYYTPNRQIDICGHATVATFSMLRNLGQVEAGPHRFDTQIGSQEVEVRPESVGLWQRELRSELLLRAQLIAPVSQALGLSADDLLGELRIASNGSAFLMLELATSERLRSVQPVQAQIAQISEQLDLVGFYLFVRREHGVVETRMFAPRYAIPEESATGMAAGALALAHRELARDNLLLVEQGHLMPVSSPALLRVEIHADQRALVSGQAQLRRSLQLETAGLLTPE
jgi:PhzF family phenazine biosynthesis protein